MIKNKINLVITIKKYTAHVYDGCLPLVTAMVKNLRIYTFSFCFYYSFLLMHVQQRQYSYALFS